MHHPRIGFLFVLATFLAAACGNARLPDTLGGADRSGTAAAMADSSRFTSIQWLDSSSRDYGKIEEGTMLNVAFRFRNTGSTPLVIGRVQPSCGCTVAEQSQAPIAPGEEGVIKATFNSQGRTGVNHKTLYVTANTRGTQTYSLHFVVEVERKPS